MLDTNNYPYRKVLTSGTQAISIDYFIEDGEVLVEITPASGAATFTGTVGTDYSLTGAGDENGGTCTMIGRAVGDIVVISRNMSFTQELNLPLKGKFSEEDIEQQFDELTMNDQQLKGDVDRSLKIPSDESVTDARTTLPANPGTDKALGVDSSGNLVWLEPSTVAASDSASITYNQGGTGAVDTTVKAKLQEIASVKDFGAVGDGIADDYSAIQLAFPIGLSNAVVKFPAGKYRIETQIDLSNLTNVIIDFRGCTIDNRTAPTPTTWDGGRAFSLSGTCSNVTFLGGTIECHEVANGSGEATVGHSGIQFDSGGSYTEIYYDSIKVTDCRVGLAFADETSVTNVTDCIARNCTIEDAIGKSVSGTGYGFHFNGTRLGAINCRVVRSGRHAYYSAKGNDHIFRDCWSQDHASLFPQSTFRGAFNLGRGSGRQMFGCKVFNAFDGGVYIGQESSSSNPVRDIQVNNCYFKGVGNSVPMIVVGEQLEADTYFTEQVQISNNQFDMRDSGGVQEWFRLNNGRGVTVSNNQIWVGGNLSADLSTSALGQSSYTTAINTSDVRIENNQLIIEDANASYGVTFFRCNGGLVDENTPFITRGNTISILGTPPDDITWTFPAVSETNNQWTKEVHRYEGDPSAITNEYHIAGELFENTDPSAGQPTHYHCSNSGEPGTYIPSGQKGYRSNAGTPVGVLTPIFIGEEVRDTTGGVWYKSRGLLDTNWQAIT